MPTGSAFVIPDDWTGTTPVHFSRLQKLAEAVMFLGGNIAWSTYTPSLAAASGGLAYGAGSIRAGRYRKVGRLTTLQACVIFGTGMSPGSGLYAISLPDVPTTIGGQIAVIGNAQLVDSSATKAYQAALLGDGTLVYSNTGGVTDAAPFVWGDGDRVVVQASYEAP